MPEDASYSMTAMAFEAQNNRHAGDDKLMIQFRVLPMIDEMESAKEGRPKFNDVEHVRIMVPGNKESIVDRPVTEMDKARFQRQYDAWKSGQGELISGTPLDVAAKDPSNPHLRITLSQIEELKFFHIRTVEQLSTVSDANAQKFMGIQMLKKQAQKYLEVAKEHSGETWAKAQLAERDAEIASLKEAIKDQGEMIKDLQVRRTKPPRANVG